MVQLRWGSTLNPTCSSTAVVGFPRVVDEAIWPKRAEMGQGIAEGQSDGDTVI